MKKKLMKFFNIKNTKSFILATVMVVGIFIATVVLLFGLFVIISSPDFKTEKLYHKESTTIYALDGSELAKIGKSNLSPITYDELPEVLIDAIIATEDSRFFQHNGLDAARFTKAAFGQVVGSSSGGASTITMQVIKNTYTGDVAKGLKGIIRKFTDIYMAIFKLENNYTKEEIIEFYFNSQWLGYDGNVNYSAITGVEQASKYYFDKSVKDLSLPEASLLAGMFQNPVAYNPYRFPDKAKTRQKTVLNLMVRHGYISNEERDDVLSIEISSLLREHGNVANDIPQAAIDYILLEAEKLTGENPYTTPMEIYSTIVSSKQKVLTDLENGVNYEIPESRGDLQFGIAVTSVEDGSIVALSGGRDYQAKGTNRALIKRQPGSTAKPFMDYAPYFEYLNGSTYDMVLDEPIEYSTGGSVRNWDNKYQGLLTTKQALAVSRNTTALRTFQKVAAVDKTYIEDFVKGLGINYGSALYESASIGGFDGTSPLDLSAAFAAFGREGYYIKPYSIKEVIVLETDKKYTHKYKKERVMSAETAYMITDILMHSATIFNPEVKYPTSQVAGKSGTTTIDEQAKKALGLPNSTTMDSWNVSYTAKHSTALWIGYDKLSKEYYMTSPVINPIKRILSREIAHVNDKNVKFKVPSGIVKKEVELETFPAQLPSPFTPENMIGKEYFKKGTEPVEVSSRYSQLKNPTNFKSSVENKTITLSWEKIANPNHIDTDYLINHFNTYYEDFASKYYEQRLEYNAKSIGTIAYDIYVIKNGVEEFLVRTPNNTYTHSVNINGDYEFIIKTSYSIFKENQSSGVKTTAQVGNIEPPAEEEIE